MRRVRWRWCGQMQHVNEIQKLCPADLMVKIYEIPSFEEAKDLLQKVATAQGRLKKGVIVDVDAGVRIILRDWNEGKIPVNPDDGNLHEMNGVDKDEPTGIEDKDAGKNKERTLSRRQMETLSPAEGILNPKAKKAEKEKRKKDTQTTVEPRRQQQKTMTTTNSK